MNSKRKLEQSFLELSVDGADVAIDLLTESELLKDIPVAGMIYKFGKTLSSVPDVIFLHKVGRFLKTVNEKTTKDQRNRFAEELKKDKDKRETLYSAIFLKIDKFDDISKSDLFAKIFACFITNKIRQEDFTALASALNLATLENLKSFSERYWQERSYWSRVPCTSPEGDYGSLLSTNLVTINLDQKQKVSGELNLNIFYNLDFKITDLGCLYVYISEDFEDYFSFLNEVEKNYPINQFHHRIYSFKEVTSDNELREKVQHQFPPER